MATPEKKRGKKKIEIKEIERKDHKQVTFTKRRNGLFNKGAELCLLTGARVAFITISPGGKAFAFAQPSVDAVIQAYRNGPAAARANDAAVPRQAELLAQIGDLERRIAAEREKRPEQGFWWDRVDAGKCEGVEQLKELRRDLEGLRGTVLARADEMQRAKHERNTNDLRSADNIGIDPESSFDSFLTDELIYFADD